MSVFNSIAFDQHELVVFGHDEKAGLNAIIAVHNTQLGAAAGGCRMYPYLSTDQALTDVLRLSRGMTYKSAMAGLPFGGGKSIIIGDPKQDKTPALLHAMGDFINSLGGKYITAEDSGTSVDDMLIIGERTPYVSGIDNNTKYNGDPSPSTALGVFTGIKASVKHKLGLDKLTGIRVAIQGVGHVGYYLTELLVNAGAKVYVADISSDNTERVHQEFGAMVVSPEDIIGIEAEVFAPCAMGAIINDESIPSLNTSIVAGAANNQLAEARHADILQARDILYAPDFVINAGGIIDVYYQQSQKGRDMMQEHIVAIGDTLMSIFERAERQKQSTNVVAEELARGKLIPENDSALADTSAALAKSA